MAAIRTLDRESVAADRSTSRRSDELGYLGAVAALAALYVAVGKLGINLHVAHGVITPVWAPTGVALAALLVLGPRYWPGVALGAFLTNATSHVSVPTAFGIAVGNTLEALVGVYLLRRAGFNRSLERLRDVLALGILASLVATAVSATIGTLVLLLSGNISTGAYGSDWLLWWFGDAMGMVIVAPLLLQLARGRPPGMTRARWAEAVALLGLLGATSGLVFSGGNWNYPYLLFPLLIWAALRFGQRGAVTANFVVAIAGVFGCVSGSVVIAGASATETVQVLQVLIGSVALTLMIVAATIAERQGAEATARESASLLDGALQSTADGILVVGRDGQMSTFNEQFIRMWNLPAETARTRNDTRAIDSVLDQLEEPDQFLAKVHELYERPDVESFDVLTFKDGRVFERYSRPQRIGGEIVGRVWSFRDVSDRRRAEDLKAKFLAMATHEMRTPLTAVSGFASFLTEQWHRADDSVKYDAVVRIGEQSRRLDRLVEDLLATSQIDSGQLVVRPRLFDLHELTSVVVGGHAGAPVELVSDGPTLVRADPDHVEQMLANYLSNAEKYGRPPIRVRLCGRDGKAVVQVDDAGPGVPDAFQSQLFRRFSRGPTAIDARVHGVGLGLSIVRDLAHAQGGEAWYQQRQPVGGTFCFSVPLAE